MPNLGVDVGSEYVKAVILNQKNVLASKVLHSSDEAEIAAQEVIDSVLRTASLKADAVKSIAVTGIGRKDVSFISKNYSEPICQARGAAWLFPQARTILAMGAHSSIAVKIGKTGKIKNFVTSDKCAGGSGSFLTAMAKVLHTPLNEFDSFANTSSEQLKITNFCAVFAESEVVSLIHSKTTKEDIIGGILEAVVEKAVQLLKRIRVEEDVVVTGGVAKIKNLSSAIEKKLKITVSVPEDPMITGAIGVALLGEKRA